MGSQFGLPPGPAFPGVHSRGPLPWFQGRIQLRSQLPEIPLQHALSSRTAPGNVFQEYLAKECSEGCVLVYLLPAILSQVHTSHFGVIPKGSTGTWHLIVNMSSPEGMSVNDGIREAPYFLSYVRVEDAAKGTVAKGRGVLLAKTDIKSAYRNVPIHRDDRWLVGILQEFFFFFFYFFFFFFFTLTQPSPLVCSQLRRSLRPLLMHRNGW